MPQYKLVYFNGRGRAETLRYMLAYAGVEFEDARVTHQYWPTIKPC
jgi:glutathione S-transferase